MAFLFGQNSRKRMLGKDYEVYHTIGEGTSSKVKVGKQVSSGRLVALKMMDPEKFKSPQVQQELEILRYFGEPKNRHPNVSGLVAVLHNVEFKSKHGLPRSTYDTRMVSVIITEYMDGGDLFSYVSSGVPFNEETAQAVFQQVVRGISYLHKHGVVHLDLKPENILLGKNGIVKIADFGLSEIVKPLKSSRPKKPKKSKRRLGPLYGNGMRNVSSLNSLSSLESSTHSQSPLIHFFPSSASSTVSSSLNSYGARGIISAATSNHVSHHHSTPSSRHNSSFYDDDDDEDEEDDDDDDADVEQDVLVDEEEAGADSGASSSPKCVVYGASDDEEQVEADASLIKAISSGRSRPDSLGSIHSAHTFSGIIKKTNSYNSISSLDSGESSNSRYSKESKNSAKLTSPRLIVTSRSGSLFYQAPEVSKGNYDGAKADVYSLGVVLHVMLYGVLPYDDGEWNEQRDVYEKLENIATCTDEDGVDQVAEWREPQLLSKDVTVSPEALGLLKGTLALCPKARFSLKAIVRNGWVDASQVRGAVQKVAGVVKRRAPYVNDNRQNQSYIRKARKRGYGPRTTSEEFLA